MKFDDFKRFCIADTVYALFVYLLYSSEEDIKNTFYFFQSGIPDSVQQKLPNRRKFSLIYGWNMVRKAIALTIIRLICRMRYRIPAGSTVLAQDQIPIFGYLIGKNDYTLLSDGPQCFSSNAAYFERVQREKNSFRAFLSRLILTKWYFRLYGFNRQCKKIVVEEMDHADYVDQKLMEVVDFRETWDKASDSKREMILDIFGLSGELRKCITGRNVVLFTQQLSTDGTITEAEQIKIYRDALAGYDLSKVVIKPHPRDKVDYSKYFPECGILNSPAPMQLIGLQEWWNGFDTAITIFSSSVTSVPNAKIVWLGTEIHPKIFAYYGHRDMPRKTVCASR